MRCEGAREYIPATGPCLPELRMHEFSLASEIIRAAAGELRDVKGVSCTRLRVRVGSLSGVSAESLRFCLEAARAGTPLEGIGVEVEVVRPKLVCPACGEVECEGRFDIVCPQCSGRISGVVGGRELDVQLECEDPSEASSGPSGAPTLRGRTSA